MPSAPPFQRVLVDSAFLCSPNAHARPHAPNWPWCYIAPFKSDSKEIQGSRGGCLEEARIGGNKIVRESPTDAEKNRWARWTKVNPDYIAYHDYFVYSDYVYASIAAFEVFMIAWSLLHHTLLQFSSTCATITLLLPKCGHLIFGTFSWFCRLYYMTWWQMR